MNCSLSSTLPLRQWPRQKSQFHRSGRRQAYLGGSTHGRSPEHCRWRCCYTDRAGCGGPGPHGPSLSLVQPTHIQIRGRVSQTAAPHNIPERAGKQGQWWFSLQRNIPLCYIKGTEIQVSFVLKMVMTVMMLDGWMITMKMRQSCISKVAGLHQFSLSIMFNSCLFPLSIL